MSCSPSFASWGKAEGGGGGMGWGRLGVKVTGLTLIINKFETNKQNLPTQKFFLDFNGIDSLTYIMNHFPLRLTTLQPLSQ